MAAVMKASEFIPKLEKIANNYKTLYVMGCFGAPMTDSNKSRYTRNHEYNRQTVRTVMINSASPKTFGFDCVNLIKAVLWGWAGDYNKSYGGAKYKANGVPDVSADGMIKLCTELSTDFSNIEVGEAVWVKGHIGVYIGNGLAIECTPKWKNCVQITACNCSKSGYNRRDWTKHGKMPWIEYDMTSNPAKPSTSTSSTATSSGTTYTKKDFIKDIQAAFGAKVDGIAGPETLSKTITLSSKLNNKHPSVYYVQRWLKTLGYEEIGKIDGVAGPKFTSAVAHFQMDNNCEVDGEITARNKTWKKLLGLT